MALGVIAAAVCSAALVAVAPATMAVAVKTCVSVVADGGAAAVEVWAALAVCVACATIAVAVKMIGS